MSYALLSDSFFKQQAEHLDKDDPCRDPRYRRRRVLAEIEESKSDIMCLQEVTNYSEKDNYFFKKLDSLGYKIVIPNQKAEEKESQKLRYFDLVVAYCKDKWSLVEKVDIELYKAKYHYQRAVEDFKKTNKAMICLFQHKESGKRLAVGNMQLYHGANHDYVRQAQALYFME